MIETNDPRLQQINKEIIEKAEAKKEKAEAKNYKQKEEEINTYIKEETKKEEETKKDVEEIQALKDMLSNIGNYDDEEIKEKISAKNIENIIKLLKQGIDAESFSILLANLDQSDQNDVVKEVEEKDYEKIKEDHFTKNILSIKAREKNLVFIKHSDMFYCVEPSEIKQKDTQDILIFPKDTDVVNIVCHGTLNFMRWLFLSVTEKKAFNDLILLSNLPNSIFKIVPTAKGTINRAKNENNVVSEIVKNNKNKTIAIHGFSYGCFMATTTAVNILTEFPQQKVFLDLSCVGPDFFTSFMPGPKAIINELKKIPEEVRKNIKINITIGATSKFHYAHNSEKIYDELKKMGFNVECATYSNERKEQHYVYSDKDLVQESNNTFYIKGERSVLTKEQKETIKKFFKIDLNKKISKKENIANPNNIFLSVKDFITKKFDEQNIEEMKELVFNNPNAKIMTGLTIYEYDSIKLNYFITTNENNKRFIIKQIDIDNLLYGRKKIVIRTPKNNTYEIINAILTKDNEIKNFTKLMYEQKGDGKFIKTITKARKESNKIEISTNKSEISYDYNDQNLKILSSLGDTTDVDINDKLEKQSCVQENPIPESPLQEEKSDDVAVKYIYNKKDESIKESEQQNKDNEMNKDIKNDDEKKVIMSLIHKKGKMSKGTKFNCCGNKFAYSNIKIGGYGDIAEEEKQPTTGEFFTTEKNEINKIVINTDNINVLTTNHKFSLTYTEEKENNRNFHIDIKEPITTGEDNFGYTIKSIDIQYRDKEPKIIFNCDDGKKITIENTIEDNITKRMLTLQTSKETYKTCLENNYKVGNKFDIETLENGKTVNKSLEYNKTGKTTKENVNEYDRLQWFTKLPKMPLLLFSILQSTMSMDNKRDLQSILQLLFDRDKVISSFEENIKNPLNQLKNKATQVQIKEKIDKISDDLQTDKELLKVIKDNFNEYKDNIVENISASVNPQITQDIKDNISCIQTRIEKENITDKKDIEEKVGIYLNNILLEFKKQQSEKTIETSLLTILEDEKDRENFINDLNTFFIKTKERIKKESKKHRPDRSFKKEELTFIDKYLNNSNIKPETASKIKDKIIDICLDIQYEKSHSNDYSNEREKLKDKQLNNAEKVVIKNKLKQIQFSCIKTHINKLYEDLKFKHNIKLNKDVFNVLSNNFKEILKTATNTIKENIVKENTDNITIVKKTKKIEQEDEIINKYYPGLDEEQKQSLKQDIKRFYNDITDETVKKYKEEEELRLKEDEIINKYYPDLDKEQKQSLKQDIKRFYNDITDETVRKYKEKEKLRSKKIEQEDEIINKHYKDLNEEQKQSLRYNIKKIFSDITDETVNQYNFLVGLEQEEIKKQDNEITNNKINNANEIKQIKIEKQDDNIVNNDKDYFNFIKKYTKNTKVQKVLEDKIIEIKNKIQNLNIKNTIQVNKTIKEEINNLISNIENSIKTKQNEIDTLYKQDETLISLPKNKKIFKEIEQEIKDTYNTVKEKELIASTYNDNIKDIATIEKEIKEKKYYQDKFNKENQEFWKNYENKYYRNLISQLADITNTEEDRKKIIDDWLEGKLIQTKSNKTKPLTKEDIKKIKEELLTLRNEIKKEQGDSADELDEKNNRPLEKLNQLIKKIEKINEVERLFDEKNIYFGKDELLDNENIDILAQKNIDNQKTKYTLLNNSKNLQEDEEGYNNSSLNIEQEVDNTTKQEKNKYLFKLSLIENTDENENNCIYENENNCIYFDVRLKESVKKYRDDNDYIFVTESKDYTITIDKDKIVFQNKKNNQNITIEDDAIIMHTEKGEEVVYHPKEDEASSKNNKDMIDKLEDFIYNKLYDILKQSKLSKLIFLDPERSSAKSPDIEDYIRNIALIRMQMFYRTKKNFVYDEINKKFIFSYHYIKNKQQNENIKTKQREKQEEEQKEEQERTNLKIKKPIKRRNTISYTQKRKKIDSYQTDCSNNIKQEGQNIG